MLVDRLDEARQRYMDEHCEGMSLEEYFRMHMMGEFPPQEPPPSDHLLIIKARRSPSDEFPIERSLLGGRDEE